MINIINLETYKKENTTYVGIYLIEPLEIGQGITLGNMLRRTLLSNLTTFAITGARVNNLNNEYQKIDGLHEDTLEILLNLKEIVFKSSLSLINKYLKYKGYLNTYGPIIITAGLFNLPKNILKIINPQQYIGTLLTGNVFNLEIDIENKNNTKKVKNSYQKINDIFNSEAATLKIDNNFLIIKNITYKVNLIYDTFGNLKESLSLEITTNGSLTPKRCLLDSLKLLINLLYSLLYNKTEKVLSTLMLNPLFL